MAIFDELNIDFVYTIIIRKERKEAADENRAGRNRNPIF
jgi:hypothetical protein